MIFFEWRVKPTEEERGELLVRVTHFAKKLKWQFQYEGAEWDYNRVPSREDWEILHSQARARYQRGKLAFKIVQLVEQGLAQAIREEKAAEAARSQRHNPEG